MCWLRLKTIKCASEISTNFLKLSLENENIKN